MLNANQDPRYLIKFHIWYIWHTIATICVSGYYGLICILTLILYFVMFCFYKNVCKFELKRTKWKLIGLLTILVVGIGIISSIIVDNLMESWRFPVPPSSPPSAHLGFASVMAMGFFLAFGHDIFKFKPKRLRDLIVCFISLFNGITILGCVIIDFIESQVLLPRQ